MKTNVPFFLILGISLTVIMACSSKKGDRETMASQGREDWPEMESFHMVMAEAYHPYKDSANLEPIKSLAENLAKESATWAAAAPPPAVDNEEVKAMLEKLKTDCRGLADQIKAGAPNEQIGASLTALHESFHTILEAWHHSKEKGR